MNRTANRRRAHAKPSLESLEARALLSTGVHSISHSSVAALIARHNLLSLPSGGPGLPYILRAIEGGAGYEWYALLKSEQSQIVAQSFGGGHVEYRANGLVAEVPPYLLAAYRGRAHDRVAPMVAAATVLKNSQIELAAIMRGPFTNYNGTDYIVFGINRGAGTKLPPPVPSEPWITPDAVVTVAVGPNGSTYSATLTDRTTGVTEAINPRNVQVAGPVVRVLLSAGQVPSKGLPITAYRFVMWSEAAPSATPSVLAGTEPRKQMLPIGVELNVAPTMS